MIERERKFLVKYLPVREIDSSVPIRQAYLNFDENEFNLRVRVHGNVGSITVKEKAAKESRIEIEFQVDKNLADIILNTIPIERTIRKSRHYINVQGRGWTIDVFDYPSKDFMLAEVEIDENEVVELLPDWVSKEVTGDPKYYNSNMLDHT